jgi:hypothetical protein
MSRPSNVAAATVAKANTAPALTTFVSIVPSSFAETCGQPGDPGVAAGGTGGLGRRRHRRRRHCRLHESDQKQENDRHRQRCSRFVYFNAKFGTFRES